jgi:hypothetical protein
MILSWLAQPSHSSFLIVITSRAFLSRFSTQWLGWIKLASARGVLHCGMAAAGLRDLFRHFHFQEWEKGRNNLKQITINAN